MDEPKPLTVDYKMYIIDYKMYMEAGHVGKTLFFKSAC